MKVEFSVLAIYDMRATQKGINVEADLTRGQVQHLIVELLGKTMPEHEAYEFMRSEFPDWFKPVQP